jgi:hypothetical protein
VIATIEKLEQENKSLLMQLDLEFKKSSKLMDKLDIIRQKELEDEERLADIVHAEVTKAVDPLQKENSALRSRKIF